MLCHATLYYTILYHLSYLSQIKIINQSTCFNPGTHTMKYINNETHEQCLLDNSHDWKWLDEDAVEVLIKKKVSNIIILYCHVQCSAVQCSTAQYSTAQYSTAQCSAVQYSTVQYSTLCSLMFDMFFDFMFT